LLQKSLLKRASNNTVVNILVRSKIRDAILNNNVVYYSIDVRDDERPDILATKYYGSSDHTWILFYANEIYDAEYDWVLPYKSFNKYLLKKYGGTSPLDCARSLGQIKKVTTVGSILTYEARYTPLKNGDQVISPSGQIRDITSVTNTTEVMLELPFSNNLNNVVCDVRTKIHSYYDASLNQIDYTTWNALPVEERSEKTFYQYESEENEKKRTIRVLDKVFYQQIVTEFESIFK
jgi:hypothetical protein